MPVVPICSVPQSREGYYATNNQFQMSGPKGFTEFKIMENDDLFVRIDLPGVPRNGVSVKLDGSKKTLAIEALAPKEHKHDLSPRRYSTSTGLVCDCCFISRFCFDMLDGVLRLLLSKTKINASRPSCLDIASRPHARVCTDPFDPRLTGRELAPHPCVVEGPEMAYEWKQLQNGGMYVRVDMPGVPKERFKVLVECGRVMVIGQSPAVGFDSHGRSYGSNVAMLSSLADIPSRRIKTIAKNGVLRLIIPPV
ncbi:PREDICTED: putative 57 kDa heat shock protein [Tarenaya hassleriana]|uniref:putative 57 kDa heat shock protein n=1 Tax=Tarenaya hassleriana TaxID=28532 RepID=UPI00053C2828|nr:PREDICTED: putative 57 kDa heat shock protein [Tarenaya hassleriana]